MQGRNSPLQTIVPDCFRSDLCCAQRIDTVFSRVLVPYTDLLTPGFHRWGLTYIYNPINFIPFSIFPCNYSENRQNGNTLNVTKRQKL